MKIKTEKKEHEKEKRNTASCRACKQADKLQNQTVICLYRQVKCNEKSLMKLSVVPVKTSKTLKC